MLRASFRQSVAVPFLFVFVIVPGCTPSAPPKPAYPATEKHPVTDTYHGTQVTDDYLWLADFGDPKVKAWVDEQNA
ncbi:MAG: hypothetical protein AB1428_13795, partial [Bacteroidota bacterium]